MPAARGFKQEEETSSPAQGEKFSLARIANLIALHLIQGKSQTDQIILLHRAGFNNYEIALLIGTTKDTAKVTIYQQTKAKDKRKVNSKKTKRSADPVD